MTQRRIFPRAAPQGERKMMFIAFRQPAGKTTAPFAETKSDFRCLIPSGLRRAICEH